MTEDAAQLAENAVEMVDAVTPGTTVTLSTVRGDVARTARFAPVEVVTVDVSIPDIHPALVMISAAPPEIPASVMPRATLHAAPAVVTTTSLPRPLPLPRATPTLSRLRTILSLRRLPPW